jgi:hypothetical protein
MIEYCKGYKYQLRADYQIQTPIFPDEDVVTELVQLTRDGMLTIRKYFAWDGASWPAIDTRTNMRAALVHDALYYLMRCAGLDLKWRGTSDWMLQQIMVEDGAWPFRASYYFSAVQAFAERYAQTPRKIHTAP